MFCFLLSISYLFQVICIWTDTKTVRFNYRSLLSGACKQGLQMFPQSPLLSGLILLSEFQKNPRNLICRRHKFECIYFVWKTGPSLLYKNETFYRQTAYGCYGCKVDRRQRRKYHSTVSVDTGGTRKRGSQQPRPRQTRRLTSSTASLAKLQRKWWLCKK
jgi:hypothetical protein